LLSKCAKLRKSADVQDTVDWGKEEGERGDPVWQFKEEIKTRAPHGPREELALGRRLN